MTQHKTNSAFGMLVKNNNELYCLCSVHCIRELSSFNHRIISVAITEIKIYLLVTSNQGLMPYQNIIEN